jgi:hypothetical protein
LPCRDYRTLLPVLELVKLAFGETLYESQSQIRQVYFRNDCFVSMLGADKAAEVGLIGSEGMIGVPMALGVAGAYLANERDFLLALGDRVLAELARSGSVKGAGGL